MNQPTPSFPGGSKSRVNRAGQAVRRGTHSTEDIEVIEAYRAAHRQILNTFQAILRSRSRNKPITVAQRHKRRNTIFNKLKRYPSMRLSQMDDIAGCRVIFRTNDELETFRNKIHKARFKHKLRTSKDGNKDKYNYIINPKSTGYRGIHDIYEYDVNSTQGAHLKGLFIEVQYRTLVQHAWATTVELIGTITKSQPKFQQGDKRYEKIMSLASEILARSEENLRGPYPNQTNKELLDNFEELDQELRLLQTLRGLKKSAATISINKHRNIILKLSPNDQLEVLTFKDAPRALEELFKLESKFPDDNIVLVKAKTSQEIQLSYRNYFADAKDFLTLIDRSKTKLKKSFST